MCGSTRSPHLFFGKLIYSRAMSRSLNWRVLTLADENHRGEPREILVKCFKNFVYPRFARRKIRQIPKGISKYYVH